MVIRARLLLLVLLSARAAYPQTASALDTLYETNQWFQLRDAVHRDPNAPRFFRGAVELAFHQWDQAERDLRAAADAIPSSLTLDTMDQASQAALAMKSLGDLYNLTGRYKDAADQFERYQTYVGTFGPNSLLAKASAHEKRTFRALYAAMARYPDQSVEKREYSQMPYSASRGRPLIRVIIDGKAESMMLDTGSSANFINASTAKRLGLVVHSGESPVAAYDGATEKTRGFAIANDMAIGNCRLRNVAFFVNAEDDEEAPGILGLPALFALGTLRWGSDGILEFGFSTDGTGQAANLATTGEQIVTEASVGGQRLILNIDTGTDETLVYPAFAKALGVQPESSGNLLDRAVLAARPSKMRVAGFDAAISSANLVFTKQTSDFSGLDGNLGLDVLEQGSSLTLDLLTMHVTVDAPAGRGGFLGANPARCALPPGFVCQQGFACTIWLQDDTPCTIDRMAAGEVAKAPAACVLPPNVTCGRMETCAVSAGANGECAVAKSAATTVLTSESANSPAAGTGAPSLPKANLTDAEVRDLLKAVTDDDLNFEPSRDYVYLDDEETRFLDAKGNITDTHVQTHESVVLYGERYSKLIAKDGKPLSLKDTRSEQQKLDRESDHRKKETPEARSRRVAEDRACTAEFLSAFQFRSVGVESLEGRPAWKVEADGLPVSAPKCKGAKNAKLFHLRFWIDQGDKQLAKLEADNVERVTWGAILIRVPPGAMHVSEQMTRRDAGVWLPAHLRVRIDIKLVLLKTFRLEVLTAYHDYRKFQAESKIVE